MPQQNNDPILITVKDGHWLAHTEEPRSARSIWLYAVLQRQGGIAESVEDGSYRYNVRRRGFRLEASLTKTED